MKSKLTFSAIGVTLLILITYILYNGNMIPGVSKKSPESDARTLLTAIYTSESLHFQKFNSYHLDFETLNFLPEGRFDYIVGFNPNCRSQLFEHDGLISTNMMENSDKYPNTSTNPDTLQHVDQIMEVFRNFTNCRDIKKGFLAIAVGISENKRELNIWTIDEKKKLVNHPNKPLGN